MLEWKSLRLKRSTHSTIASEAASLDAGTGHAFFIAMALSELIDMNFRATTYKKPVVPTYPCTDCKSLYDALKKLSAVCDEKHMQIDINSIKESVDVTSLKVGTDRGNVG